MRKVIHGVDAPRVPRPVMMRMGDAVDDRIAHDEIGRCHIDLCTQDTRTVWELPRAHPPEEV